MMMSIYVSCSPVRDQMLTNSCYGNSDKPPDNLPLFALIDILKGDSQTILEKAKQLMIFYETQQANDSQPRITQTALSIISPYLNFTNSATSSDDDLATVLLNDYKNLSRGFIYFEAMIDNERACSPKNRTLPLLNDLKDALYNTLCRVDITIRKLNSRVTSYENRDTVLPDEIKAVPGNCTARRFLWDYYVFYNTKRHASELLSRYTNVSYSLSSSTTLAPRASED